MKLPPLPPLLDPGRYVGLYVFDFGGWASVGYTAEEIAMLLESEEHRGGHAYRIYRVDAEGRIELIGVTQDALAGESILLFAYRDDSRVADDFAALRRKAAELHPPQDIEMAMADIAELEPPHVLALIHPRHSADAVAQWLTAIAFDGGDLAMGGGEVLGLYRGYDPSLVARCVLQGDPAVRSRTRQQVLDAIHQPLQR